VMSMKVTIILLLTMVVLLQSSLSCPMVFGTGRKGSVAVAQLLEDCPSGHILRWAICKAGAN
jgi:hypothetical protein